MGINIATRDGGTLVVALEGVFDATNVNEAAPLLDDSFGIEGWAVVFDLRGLRCVDSQGIRALFRLNNLFKQSVSLSVALPEGQPRAILDRLGLTERLVDRPMLLRGPHAAMPRTLVATGT